MLLFLIRHALTAATGQVLTGWLPGFSLSDEGTKQVTSLVERMRPVHLDAVYSSPLERTVETARPIASSKGLRVRTRDGLGEVRYGSWEGKRLRVLAKTKLWRSVMARPSDVRFPGGETIRETQARAVDTIEEIRTEHPRGAVATVSHADVIRLVVAHYAGIHLDLFQRLALAPASVSVLYIGDTRTAVLKLNETGGLEGLTQPRAHRR